MLYEQKQLILFILNIPIEANVSISKIIQVKTEEGRRPVKDFDVCYLNWVFISCYKFVRIQGVYSKYFHYANNTAIYSYFRAWYKK